MNVPTKTDLAAGLEKLADFVCDDDGNPFCQCEFGPEKSGRLHHTGCPEVRTAASLFRAMTEAEYEAIVSRAYLTKANPAGDLPPRTWLPLLAMKFGEEFVTKSGAVGKRTHADLGKEPDPGFLRVRWSETGKATNVSQDTLVARLPHKTVTTKEPKVIAHLGDVTRVTLANVRPGYPFTLDNGVRARLLDSNVTTDGLMKVYPMRASEPCELSATTVVTLDEGTPISPLAVLPQERPVRGLFAIARERGGGIERSGSFITFKVNDKPEGRLSLAAGSFGMDALHAIVHFAKKYVHGPWFVDLGTDLAADLWREFDVLTQQKFRLVKSFETPPGFMFAYCGVDICEVW